MRSKRLSVEIGITSKVPVQEQSWEPAPASRRNTADMLKEHSAAVLIKGYRAYLRGDYVDTRRFAHFMERARDKRDETLEQEFSYYKNAGKVTRLRRLESRFDWGLSIRENVSAFILGILHLNSNCRLRRVKSAVQSGERQLQRV